MEKRLTFHDSDIAEAMDHIVLRLKQVTFRAG
jgi:hypothetical protein